MQDNVVELKVQIENQRDNFRYDNIIQNKNQENDKLEGWNEGVSFQRVTFWRDEKVSMLEFSYN